MQRLLLLTKQNKKKWERTNDRNKKKKKERNIKLLTIRRWRYIAHKGLVFLTLKLNVLRPRQVCGEGDYWVQPIDLVRGAITLTILVVIRVAMFSRILHAQLIQPEVDRNLSNMRTCNFIWLTAMILFFQYIRDTYIYDASLVAFNMNKSVRIII